MDIYEVIEKLTGNIQPTGDSKIDAERIKNMDDAFRAVNYLVLSIQQAAEKSNMNPSHN